MCLCLFNSLKTLNDMKYASKDATFEIPKDSFKVLIIDDEKKNLKSLANECHRADYNVELIDDYDENGKCAGYNLILVDIRGVGEEFADTSGIGVAERLACDFPASEIKLFTASTIESEQDKRGFEVIKKPIKGKDLCDVFDRVRKQLADPNYCWKKIEKECFKKNLSFKDIAWIQDKFVRTFNKREFSYFENHYYGQVVERVGKYLGDFFLQLVQNILISYMTKQ